MTPVYETHLPLPLHARGKVRDTYALGDALLMIATDRLSAFDVVLPTPIPDKGRILTQLSVFWFRRFESWMPHHLISAEWADIADALRQAGLNPDEYRETLDGRTMLVKRATPILIECVARGYIVQLCRELLQHGRTVYVMTQRLDHLPGNRQILEAGATPFMPQA